MTKEMCSDLDKLQYETAKHLLEPGRMFEAAELEDILSAPIKRSGRVSINAVCEEFDLYGEQLVRCRVEWIFLAR